MYWTVGAKLHAPRPPRSKTNPSVISGNLALPCRGGCGGRQAKSIFKIRKLGFPLLRGEEGIQRCSYRRSPGPPPREAEARPHSPESGARLFMSINIFISVTPILPACFVGAEEMYGALQKPERIFETYRPTCGTSALALESHQTHVYGFEKSLISGHRSICL